MLIKILGWNPIAIQKKKNLQSIGTMIDSEVFNYVCKSGLKSSLYFTNPGLLYNGLVYPNPQINPHPTVNRTDLPNGLPV